MLSALHLPPLQFAATGIDGYLSARNPNTALARCRHPPSDQKHLLAIYPLVTTTCVTNSALAHWSEGGLGEVSSQLVLDHIVLGVVSSSSGDDNAIRCGLNCAVIIHVQFERPWLSRGSVHGDPLRGVQVV